MTDMLVKLYEIEDDWSFLQGQKQKGILIRKPIGPEKDTACEWVKKCFSGPWATELGMAFNNWPISCFLAVKDEKMIGFACYDATALGFFGPTGVEELHRGNGTGKALFMACMLDMKMKGYGYAIIGGIGPAKFYEKAAGATIIEGSGMGIYKHCLKTDDFYDI